jgi:hypothetical protein
MSQEVQVFQENTSLAPTEAMKALAATQMVDDLAGGMSGNYAIVSIRGGKWRIKFHGDENPIVDRNGEPVPSLEAVIIKANPFLTKQYFKGGYEDGDASAPVCYSTDGKVPAAGAPEKQHTNCALCPQNKFGSRVTDTGVEVKACQDNRKLAVVPLADIENTAFGGPMLFRVPASALKGLVTLGQTMKSRGYPYNGVAVRLGFDMDVSYPKPTFKAIRPLTEAEFAKVAELYSSAAVEQVLGGEAAASGATATTPTAPEQAKVDPDFEQPVATPIPVATAPAPVAAAAPAKPAKPASKPRTKPEAPKTNGITLGAAAPAATSQPAPVQPVAAASPAATPNLQDDISSILAELNAE